MPVRLEVALPATVTFVFGLAAGLVIGHVVTKDGEPAQGPPPVAAVSPEQVQAPAGGPSEAEARRTLDVHLQLLEGKPDDVHLLRTVGNYHAMLGELDQAMARYRRAEELARAGADQAELPQLLVDRAVVHAEQGDLPQALEVLQEAAALDPEDTRSRMSAAYLYLVRVMPAPPPGFDRRTAVQKAEILLDEVLALEPDNADARRFKDLIVSVRQGRLGTPPAAPATEAGATTP